MWRSCCKPGFETRLPKNYANRRKWRGLAASFPVNMEPPRTLDIGRLARDRFKTMLNRVNINLRKLPLDQRIRLVEDLWDSIASDRNALPLTAEQRMELDLRLDAYEIDGDPGRSAEAAIADIRKRL